MHTTYVPSSIDIIRAPEQVRTLRDTRLSLKGVTVELIEPPHNNLPKILNQFEDTEGCLAYVDISTYDRYLKDDDNKTALQMTLHYLQAVFSTGLFASKGVLLFITNTAAFEQKLPTSPLSAHFPEYTGPNDANLAMKFIMKKCKQAVASEFLYTHFATNTEDPTTVQFFKSKAEGLRTVLELRRFMA